MDINGAKAMLFLRLHGWCRFGRSSNDPVYEGMALDGIGHVEDVDPRAELRITVGPEEGNSERKNEVRVPRESRA